MAAKPTKATTAKDLIAAHRRATIRHSASQIAIHSLPTIERVHVVVAEIGPRCLASDLEQLDRIAQTHIMHQGMDAVASSAFRKKIAGYREALSILLGLREDWDKDNKRTELLAEDCASYDERERCYKALIARLKSHPRDIPEIARYFGSQEANPDGIWRPREVLRTIAGSK